MTLVGIDDEFLVVGVVRSILATLFVMNVGEKVYVMIITHQFPNSLTAPNTYILYIDFFPRDHQKRKQKNMDKPPTPTWDLPNCKSLYNIHPSSQANIPRRRKKFWCCAPFAMWTWPSSWHLMCHCILDFSIYRWMRGNPRGNRYGVFFLIHSAMLSWFGIAESCADMICAKILFRCIV